MLYQAKFTRQLLLSIILTVIFFILAFFISHLINRPQMNQFSHRPPEHSIAKIIDELGVDPEKFISIYQTRISDNFPFTLELLKGEQLQHLAPYIQLPEKTFEVKNQGPEEVRNPFFPSPPHPPETSIVKLNTPDPQYIVIHFKKSKNAEGKNFFLYNMLSLLLGVVLAITLSLIILFRSLKAKNTQAHKIIEDLKHGNLKARFAISKKDKLSQTMESFNQMADEIEALVERLKKTEESRMVMLQQLAHDLRTPIASLKSLTETLADTKNKLSQQTHQELLDLSLKEILYFEQLVEDLLFLAQVSEPKYTLQKEALSLNYLLDEQSLLLAKKYPHVELSKIGFENANSMDGDKKLLERLFRNILENAFSFAQKTCRIEIVKNANQHFQIKIFNDGPPMSTQEILDFGQKKKSRFLSKSQSGRVSVGLGSVIVLAVVQAHEGTVEIQNTQSPQGVEIIVTL